MLNGIFSNPAFGMEALTDSILNVPFVPTAARALGIFENEGIATTTLDLELDSVSMTLIPVTQRGGPATKFRQAKRTMRSLKVPHLQLSDTIKPEEIQNVRLFGSNNQLQSAQAVVNKRLTGMALSHDVTLEYQSIGAIKGVIYDSDGATVIYNLFDEFQIAQTTFDFLLGDANQDMKHWCLKVKRAIEIGLGAARVYSHIHCFCGNDWFDAFVAHPDVVAAYRLWQDRSNQGQYGDFARNDNRSGFQFAGITFENYIGGVGGVDFVPAGEAHFFPVGVPNLFRTVFSPGDFWETVNTIGLPRYARGEPLRMGRGLELITESNPLCYCTRPVALIKATTSSYPTGIP